MAKHAAGLPLVKAMVAPASGDKPVWLFNERVYSRIGVTKEGLGVHVAEQEALWLIRALDGIWTVAVASPRCVLISCPFCNVKRTLASTYA